MLALVQGRISFSHWVRFRLNKHDAPASVLQCSRRIHSLALRACSLGGFFNLISRRALAPVPFGPRGVKTGASALRLIETGRHRDEIGKPLATSATSVP